PGQPHPRAGLRPRPRRRPAAAPAARGRLAAGHGRRAAGRGPPGALRLVPAVTTTRPLDSEPGTLGTLVRKGLGWSFLNTVVGRVGTVLVGIVLARLLTPADYGVFAVALVALNALLSMNELGVSLAIVRWPGALDRLGPTGPTLATAGR